MTSVGANSPSSVPSLLLGCIQAYKQAVHEQNTSIASAAKQGVLALAKLSQRDCSRVRLKLQSARIMWDTQLELAIETPHLDATAAARLLIEQGTPEGSCPLDKPILTTQQSAGEDSVIEYSRIDEDEHLPSKPSPEPRLVVLLPKLPILYKKTLEYFIQGFQAVTEAKNLPRGKLLVLLKGYSYLLMTTYPVPSNKLDFSCYLSKSMLPKLKSLTDKVLELVVEQSKGIAVTPTSPMDSLIQHLYCVLLLSIARMFQGTPATGADAPEIGHALYAQIGEFPGQSWRVRGFRSGIDRAIAGNSPSVLHSLVVGVVSSHSIPLPPASASQAGIEDGWKQVCEYLRPLNRVDPPEMEDFEDLETILSVMLLELKRPNSLDIDDSKVGAALKSLLSGEQCQVHEALRMGELASTFVSKATKHLVRVGLLMIPLVLSTTLEREGSCLFQKVTREARSKYLLQVLHAFEYLEANPRSPFAFDPRVIPLRRALEYATEFQTSFLCNRLCELTRTHCAEVFLRFERSNLVSFPKFDNIFSSPIRGQATSTFYELLRASVLNVDNDTDTCRRIETIFLQAQVAFPESDLCCIVCSALLASWHRPRPFVTYHALLRDPLVLLKCPAKIWRSRSLRRIALLVLSSLLESNEIIARQLTPLESSVEEYIASRDLMVVRCLLVCLAGADFGTSSLDCAMTTNSIRSMISAHEGIVAALIRQGLPEKALDWLVEYVPESMKDSQLLLHSLSDRGSLTAAERLVAADAVLRIAIMHGHIDENESSTMASSALAQLIGSFFLVIGPVDVPVNALIVDDSGLDATQIARKAACRMLEALMRVRARRDGLRRTCGMALQKLAVLCKNESGIVGVSGAVAGQRKAFLKELYDMVLKAGTNMGGVFGN